MKVAVAVPELLGLKLLHVTGVPTITGLLIVHGPAASEARPSTLTVTVVLGRATAGVIVTVGTTVKLVVPLSDPQVSVRV